MISLASNVHRANTDESHSFQAFPISDQLILIEHHYLIHYFVSNIPLAWVYDLPPSLLPTQIILFPVRAQKWAASIERGETSVSNYLKSDWLQFECSLFYYRSYIL